MQVGCESGIRNAHLVDAYYKAGCTKEPLSSLLTVRVWFVSTCLQTTFTPVIRPPLASLMVPSNVHPSSTSGLLKGHASQNEQQHKKARVSE